MENQKTSFVAESRFHGGLSTFLGKVSRAVVLLCLISQEEEAEVGYVPGRFLSVLVACVFQLLVNSQLNWSLAFSTTIKLAQQLLAHFQSRASFRFLLECIKWLCCPRNQHQALDRSRSSLNKLTPRILELSMRPFSRWPVMLAQSLTISTESTRCTKWWRNKASCWNWSAEQKAWMQEGAKASWPGSRKSSVHKNIPHD